MINIILADDHQIFRQGLKSLLELEPMIKVVAEASSGKEVMELIDEHKPNLILLDIEMPGMDGLETLRQIKKRKERVKVLVLTMHSESSYIGQMLKAGAMGYVLKDAGKSELMKAIETVHQGKNYFSQNITNSVMKGLTTTDNSNLTKREIEIIKLIADQMTTTEIADKLSLSPHTIEAHRKNILLKLGLRNSAGLARYAVEKGLID